MKNIQNIKEKVVFAAVFIIALGYALFLWNFWTYGSQAIGVNLTIFWWVVLIFFVFVQGDKLTVKVLLWIIPLVIIAFSFCIYTSTFTTWISLIIFPVLFFIFTTHQVHQKLQSILWSRFLPVTVIFLGAHLFTSIFSKSHKKLAEPVKVNMKMNKKSQEITKQIIMGLVVLIALATFVVVPLLSSADASFARVITNFLNLFPNIIEYFANLFRFFDIITIFRIISFIVVASVLFGLRTYWNKNINSYYALSKKDSIEKNAITVGIILGGILLLYLLFIFIQIKTLFVSALPVDFAQAESLVKTGFWQLFALTVLNILFFAGIYRKSTKIVQGILAAFTFSSLLLIFAAAQRIYLYVVNYGLSYEKFFALYTVIYCGVVFVWFMLLFVGKSEEIQIIRKLAFLALWMYAITTILPLDHIIFTTNLRLTQQSESRVNINELTMLGFDALPVIEKNFDVLMKEARMDYPLYSDTRRGLIQQQNYAEEDYLRRSVDLRWLKWVKENLDKQTTLRKWRRIDCPQYSSNYNIDCQDLKFRETPYQQKKWYEKTFIELFYKPTAIETKFKLLKNKLFDKQKTKIFSDNIHGFTFAYQSDITKVDFKDDSHLRSELLDQDFTIDITSEYIGSLVENMPYDYITIDGYNINDDTQSKNSKMYQKILAEVDINNTRHVSLPNLEKTSAYLITEFEKAGQNSGKYHKLLIKLPQVILVIKGNMLDLDFDSKLNVDADEYLKSMTMSRELINVIKSLRIIEVK